MMSFKAKYFLLPCSSATLTANEHIPFHNTVHDKLIHNTLHKETTLHNKPANKTGSRAIHHNLI